MENLEETSPYGGTGHSQIATPSSLKERAVGLLVNGLINANEDWNSRRLRYNLKKYGKIKANKLGQSCNDFDLQGSLPDSFRRVSLRRQVSLMTQLGTPTPFSPAGITVYRNNALRTLSNLVMDTAVRRHRNLNRNKRDLSTDRMSTFEPTVLKLPAGTIVSASTGNESAALDNLGLELKGTNEHRKEYVPLSSRLEFSSRRVLGSAPAKDAEGPMDSKCSSCIELQTFSLSKAPCAKPVDLPRQARRIFFPSTSTSQLSKTPDLIDGFEDIEADFDVDLTNDPTDIAALDARILSHFESKKPVVSRLSLLRPPPLDLGIKNDFIEPLDNRTTIHPSQPLDVDTGTPYFIGYPKNTSLSPLSPLMFVKPYRSKRAKFFNRRRLGGRFKFLGQHFRRSKQMDEIYQRVDDSMLDYRPYFTYMLCFIHLLVTVFACIGYGFAPIGINLERIMTKQLMMPSLDIENVCRVQDENIWIGPQQADLVRMGARFSPCMRFDETLNRVVVEAQKIWDRKSGCCINMRDGTCYQTSRFFCSRSTSTWLHNSEDSGLLLAEPSFHSRIVDWLRPSLSSTNPLTPTMRPLLIGPVCGLDPEFCAEPRSTGPFSWSFTDVTEWPICTRPINSSTLAGFAPHMDCEVVARPCCVGLKGECIITTSSHCHFLQGRFHSEARLCSQVRCLQEVCGMIPFVFPDVPDQLSRIFISLFLHAGILHLALSLFIQLTIMRHLEKLLGCVRIATVFVLSGCFSGLVSGIMLPYHIHTGPMGAHFALFGVTLMDSLQTIDIFMSPWSVIIKQVVYVVVGFFIGFLPCLDNCAHISGFISGVLLAYVFVPYLGYGSKNQLTLLQVSTLRSQATASDPDHEIYQCKLQELYRQMRRRKFKVIVVCLIIWIILFLILLVVFIKWPLTSCTWCKYLDCLPWTPTLCVHAHTKCISPRT